jgi:hypothetical protein
MGLTKLRAAQIYNLDYKQSTRVATVSNITLSGGAPTPVDGVSVSVGDRVLVTGQSTASQNGLYQVATVGSGANGTWVRTKDGDQTGEIEAGMIVMVTEGTEYGDTQWKLITDDPIVIGTTALTFVFNVQTSTISNGTSNVVVNANANVIISSADTANVAVFSNTGAFVSGITSVTGNVTGGNITTAGVISAVGNITGNFFLGNGSQLTGIDATSIQNGTSNVRVVSSGGNVAIGIGGVSNVAVVATTGVFVAGLTSVTGNITGGNVLTAGLISATGNITGGNILGNGAGLSGINVFSNITVTGGNSAVADSIADTLTLTAGDGITIVVDSATDTITFGVQSGSELFVDGADFGTVEEPVTLSDDLGLVTDAVTEEADLGTLVTSGLIYPDQFVLPSYTVSTLPAATPAGQMAYVTNESGGAVPAFADGTNWRRVTDRAIVT